MPYANPVKQEAYQRRYQREYARKLRAADPTLAARHQREWRKKHPNYNKEHSAIWEKRHPDKAMWKSARRRAKDKGIKFSIKPRDIVIPKVCPVFGIPLRKCGRGFNNETSPTLDRVNVKRGYVRDNVCVISGRANRIKGNSTIAELRSIIRYMKRMGLNGGTDAHRQTSQRRAN